MSETNTAAKPGSIALRVMFLDASRTRYAEVMTSLEEGGVEILHTNKRDEAVETALKFKPDLMVVNLFLDNASNLPIVRELKKLFEKQGLKILVVTGHHSRENILECLRAGATDFILEPFDARLLLQRIRYQLQDRTAYAPDDLKAEPTQVAAGFQMLYDALRILAEVKDPQRAIYEVLKLVADMSLATRVNVVLADIELNDCLVVASSDDPALMNLDVDLEKYPEVREVTLNGTIVYVKDITQNPLTKKIADQVKSIKITSLLVFPIRHRSETLGTLTIRLGNEEGLKVSDKHLKLFYMVALCLAPKLAGRKLLKKLQKPKPEATE